MTSPTIDDVNTSLVPALAGYWKCTDATIDPDGKGGAVPDHSGNAFNLTIASGFKGNYPHNPADEPAALAGIASFDADGYLQFTDGWGAFIDITAPHLLNTQAKFVVFQVTFNYKQSKGGDFDLGSAWAGTPGVPANDGPAFTGYNIQQVGQGHAARVVDANQKLFTGGNAIHLVDGVGSLVGAFCPGDRVICAGHNQTTNVLNLDVITQAGDGTPVPPILIAQGQTFGLRSQTGDPMSGIKNMAVWVFDTEPDNLEATVQFMVTNPDQLPLSWLPDGSYDTGVYNVTTYTEALASNEVTGDNADGTEVISLTDKTGTTDGAMRLSSVKAFPYGAVPQRMGPGDEYSNQVRSVAVGGGSYEQSYELMSVDYPAEFSADVYPGHLYNLEVGIASGSTFLSNATAHQFTVYPKSGNAQHANSAITAMRITADNAALQSDFLSLTTGLSLDFNFSSSQEKLGFTFLDIKHGDEAGQAQLITGLKIGINSSNSAQETCAISITSVPGTPVAAVGPAAIRWGSSQGTDNVKLLGYGPANEKSLRIMGDGVWLDNGSVTPTISNLPAGATAASAKWVRMYDDAGTAYLVPAWTA